jgi:hypothetical protein
MSQRQIHCTVTIQQHCFWQSIPAPSTIQKKRTQCEERWQPESRSCSNWQSAPQGPPCIPANKYAAVEEPPSTYRGLHAMCLLLPC